MTDPSPRDRLAATLSRRPLVLDAAMGTRLVARGLDLASDDPALWSLARPDEVAAIHRRDVAAGSDALLTNTFGANRCWLARFGRAGEVATLNRRAVALARAEAGPDRFVFGSIGPTAAGHPGAYREQAEALAGAGADALVLETHDPDTAATGLDGVIGAGLPVLVALAAWPDPPAATARRLADRGASALGFNCQAGMAVMTAWAERLEGSCPLPLLVKPSAGRPGEVPARPDTFARAVPRLVALGVRLVGGCCGTTEEHVAALRREVDALASAPPRNGPGPRELRRNPPRFPMGLRGLRIRGQSCWNRGSGGGSDDPEVGGNSEVGS